MSEIQRPLSKIYKAKQSVCELNSKHQLTLLGASLPGRAKETLSRLIYPPPPSGADNQDRAHTQLQTTSYKSIQLNGQCRPGPQGSTGTTRRNRWSIDPSSYLSFPFRAEVLVPADARSISVRNELINSHRAILAESASVSGRNRPYAALRRLCIGYRYGKAKCQRSPRIRLLSESEQIHIALEQSPRSNWDRLYPVFKLIAIFIRG